MDEEQISSIHQNSLQILSATGIRVDSAVGQDLFAEAIGKRQDPEKVLIPPELVEWAIQTAPSKVALFDRNGSEAFCLGPDFLSRTVFGIGVTNTHYQDFETDNVLPFTREHMKVSTRLGNSLSGYQAVSTIGIPSDVSEDVADIYSTLDMYANTTKPLVILLLNDNSISSVYDLISGLNKNPLEKPSIITYVNPITPLIINDSTVRKMVNSIRLGFPVAYSNYSMYGATTPSPAVGTLSLLNAELLAGLVLSQLIREGAPMILGSLPASFDMTSMESPFTPQTFLLNLACAEMMNYYGLPHCGTSGSGGGWGADLPASDMLWMNHLTSCLGKVGFAPFVGGNFESLAFSPAMAIHSNQIIRQIREFTDGIELDNFSASLADIVNTGPGGNFLTSDLTLKNMESFSATENIWKGMTIERWENEGRPEATNRLKEHTCEVMENLRYPDDHEEIMGRGEAMIRTMIDKK